MYIEWDILVFGYFKVGLSEMCIRDRMSMVAIVMAGLTVAWSLF